MKNQKKAGIIISYLNIALNMFIGVFFTPFLIKSLGDAEYGVYRVVQSFAGQLSVMTFGMSALVTRNIVYYDTQHKQKEKENFLAMALGISLILFVIAIFIGIGMYQTAGYIFKNSFSQEELIIAKRLIFLLVINIAITILNDCFAGFLTGHEKFFVSNSVKTLRLVLRIVTLVILLKAGFKSMAIVGTDVMLSFGILIFDMVYGIVILKEKIKFHYFDKVMFKSSMLFSAAILLQAIVNQINQNMDSMILGVMTDAKTVAVYSIALVIYTTYNSITSTVAGVFLPQATRMVAQDATNDELTDMVAYTGRYQLMLAGAVLSGFILFGHDFISLWVGDTYLPAYKISLILLLPVTIPLIQSVCNTILDAKMKRMSRSIVLVLMAVINVIASVIFIKKFGYIGAAYGTSLSTIIGHIIIMNIYYHKSMKLNILRMFKNIFHKILPCIIAITVVLIPLKSVNISSSIFLNFCVKIVVFIIVYSAAIYIFAMNKSEKSMIQGILGKILKRRDKNVQK